MILTAVPILHNFKWGQISVFITVCILGSWYFYENGRKIPAALLLALAVAIKYYAAFFLIYFIFKKEWKLNLTFAIATLCFLLLIPVLLLGVETNVRFFQIVGEQVNQARSTWMLEDINSQYFPNVVKKWSQLLTITPPARILWQGVGYTVVGINLLLIVKLIWQKTADESQQVFSLLFLSLAFLVETSWPHYFVYLPFCQLVALQSIQAKTNQSKLPGFILVHFLLLLSIFLSNIFYFNLFPQWQTYSTYSLLFLSNLLILPIFYRHFISPLSHQPTVVTHTMS